MEFEEVLSRRCSTRAFRPEQITQRQLETLLDAANRAPVGSAMYQDLHLTVVRDRRVLLRLCEAAWERFSSVEKVKEIAGKTAEKTAVRAGKEKPDLFYGAPTVIFVSHRRQTLQPGIEWANAATVVSQMHLAAAGMGLGSCYMWGALESMRMLPQLDNTGLLELPEDFEPLLALAVGYPAVEPKPRANAHGFIAVNYVG